MCDAAGLLHQFLKAASCMDEPFSIARIPAAAQARHTVGSSGVKPEHANRALALPIGFARASRSLFHTFPDVTADGWSLCGGRAKLFKVSRLRFHSQ